MWDELKRRTNIENHGLDFMDARIRFDFREALIEPTYPSKDGRARFTAIGPLNNDIVTAVFSPLGREGLSIISLRPASRKERKRYERS